MRQRCTGIASIRREEARRRAAKLAYWGALLDQAHGEIEQQDRDYWGDLYATVFPERQEVA